MHKGQAVKIIDGSYMTTIIGGEISHYGNSKSTRTIGWNTDSWTIVDIGGSYPSEKGFGDDKKRRNNTIIQNNKNGEIWFCDVHINIEPIKKRKRIKKTIPELTMREAIEKIGFEFKIKK
jgi:hypothetical protein